MLKYCWPTCIVVYNHRGCAMKFWLPDVILKLFAPVMEMHYTTNTRYGRENWITTSKFKISLGDKWCLCPGNQDAVKRCWECAWGIVCAGTAWLVALCLQQPARLALCCGSEHSQWHRGGDHNPSALQPPLTRRTLREYGESFQKHFNGLVSFVSFLSTIHLPRNSSPQKDNVLCLPVQPRASGNFTIKNPGCRRFAWFIRLWWLLFAFLLFFLLPTHSNLNFWTTSLLSTLNFCHASHPAQLLSDCN